MKKQTIKKRIYKLLLIILSLATVYSFVAPKFLNPTTAYAVGDLTIDWGVVNPNPIFVVSNMLPGDVEQREVDVTNDGIVARQVAIRGEKTSETLDFATVIDFVILDGATPVYGTGSATGTKTLQEFFADSADINGIPLSELAPSESTTYKFIATFDINAGNEFQNAEVIFDLIIGIFVEDNEIPAECSQIEFSGDPIFGTAIGDVLNGGPGNDLIFGLEAGDVINGNGGDDCLVGGEGGDSIRGNNGNDVIFGNEGGDSLQGNNGEDLLIGGDGGDTLKGGNDNDRLFGNDGHDGLEGGNGDDYLEGATGDDRLDGGAGNDQLFAGPGSDSLLGGQGNDLMHGNSGVDFINGGAGNDQGFGDEDLDSLAGGTNDDYLDGGAGGVGNVVNGQAGTDTCLNGTFSNCEILP